jgi:hypothetical protein
MLVVQCCAAQYVDIEKKHKNRTTYFDTDMGIMGISVHITYEVLYMLNASIDPLSFMFVIYRSFKTMYNGVVERGVEFCFNTAKHSNGELKVSWQKEKLK